jgi:hypothetical protein
VRRARGNTGGNSQGDAGEGSIHLKPAFEVNGAALASDPQAKSTRAICLGETLRRQDPRIYQIEAKIALFS